MNIKKSKRIEKIVSLIDDKVDNVYDIACDHGYIGISAILSKKTKNVVFADIANDPLNSCKKNVDNLIYENNDLSEDLDNIHVDFRLGDGLNVLSEDENVDTLIIAGIGYDLMIEILEDLDKYDIKTLILSVQSKVSDFRKYLENNNMNVVADEMIIESCKYYYIQKVRLK